MILKREISAALSFMGGFIISVQRAVDAVADAHLVLEALEVDVRRALLHGVGQDAVDQLHHRRVVDRRGEDGGVDLLFLLLDDLDVAVLLHVLEEVRERIVARLAVVLVDGVAERVLPGDDREDVVARDELEVVDDAEVRRVGHRDRQRATLALEREHQMALGELGGDELRDARVDFEVGEVHRRHAVLPGEHASKLDLVHEAQLHEVVAYAVAAGLLLLQRLLERLLIDEPLFDEELTDLQTCGCCLSGHRCSEEWSDGASGAAGPQPERYLRRHSVTESEACASAALGHRTHRRPCRSRQNDAVSR